MLEIDLGLQHNLPREAFTLVGEGLAERVKKLPVIKDFSIFFFELIDYSRIIETNINSDSCSASIRGFAGERSLKNINDVDIFLVAIAESDQISTEEKSIFFEKVKGDFERTFVGWIKNQSGEIPPDSPLPTRHVYVLNPKGVKEREGGLRGIKNDIKRMERGVKRSISDDAVDALAHIIPKSREESTSTCLKKILSGQEASETEKRLAMLDLLRLYREMVNVLIAENQTFLRVIEEQGSGEFNLRLGRQYNEIRMKATRRFTTFRNLQSGSVPASLISPAHAQSGNTMAVSPGLVKAMREGKMEIRQSERIDLDEEHQRRLEQLILIKNQDVPLARVVEIADIFLSRLGIRMNKDEEANAIACHRTGKTLRFEGRLGIFVKEDARALAISGEFGLVIIPRDLKIRVLKLCTELFGHEIGGHTIHLLARWRSLIPGLNRVTTFGRSGILAEGGALYIQHEIERLFGQEADDPFINRYHYDALMQLIQGANYWEIFNAIFEDHMTRREVSERGRAIDLTFRRINRLYKNLGASGDPRNPNGRYPTALGLLDYIYPVFPPYNALPSHISGVPAHRTEELKDFLPLPSINGEPATVERIVMLIIDVAYDELVKKKV